MLRLFWLVLSLCPLLAHSNENLKWFEIEVLVFDRLNNKTIPMTTEQPVSKALPERLQDILQPHLSPNLSSYRTALSVCEQPWQQQPEAPDDGFIDNTTKLDYQHPLIEIYGPLASWILSPLDDIKHNDLSPDWQQYTECRTTAVEQSNAADSRVTKAPSATPQKVASAYERHVDAPYILPENNNNFNDVFDKLKRSYGYRPLLHASWRQRVLFGRNQAIATRLYAGKHFQQQDTDSAITNATSSLEPIQQTPTQIDLVSLIRESLDKPVPNIDILRDNHTETNALEENQWQPEWQIDGWLKVYLQNVGRTPYLHIESELDYAVKEQQITAPNTDSGVTPEKYTLYPFKQLRRVISKQVHYFDHPMFGLVVQIRRYTPPVKETIAEQAITLTK